MGGTAPWHLARPQGARWSLSGAFVLEVVSREAERVLEEERYWKMSIETAENIQHMLAKPPAINAAAKKAAKDLAAHVQIRS